MKDFKPATCICPTYGRRNQLNEAVYSFLNQDYKGEKELLIVNDHPDVQYVFKHPEVRIINCSERFESLGEKLNYLFEQSTYEWVINWPDDDIQFSWAVSFQMAQIAEKPKQLFVPQGYFSLTNGGKPFRGGIRNLKKPLYIWGKGHLPGLISCTKKAWKIVGGYSHIDRAEDIHFVMDLKRRGFFSGFCPLKPSESYYIWRWNCGWIQMSKNRVRWESNDKGHFKIEPQWYRDYPKEVRIALKAQGLII